MMLDEITGYFASKGWQFTVSGGWVRLRVCPLPGCNSSSRDPLALNGETGAGQCFRCGWVGGLTTLRRAMGDWIAPAAQAPPKAQVKLVPMEKVRAMHVALMQNTQALDYLRNVRMLTTETITEAMLGFVPKRLFMEKGEKVYADAIAFPFFEGVGSQIQCVRVKYKARLADGSKLLTSEKGGKNCLYGVHELRGRGRAVLCEGEEDRLLLKQEGVENVVSVPNGAGANWPSSPWLDPLEPFDDIVLAFDADEAGTDAMYGHEEDQSVTPPKKERIGLLDVLGRNRCRVVQWPKDDTGAKDPTDYARRGRTNEVLDAIEYAAEMTDERVEHVSVGLAELIAEIKANPIASGDPTGLVELDEITGGWRGGEMTLLTGWPGSGKTKLAMNLALLRAMTGVPACVMTLENPVRTYKLSMLERIGMKPAKLRMDGTGIAMTARELDLAADTLSRLPIQMLNATGEQAVEEIISVVDYARRRLGVKFFVLDHFHRAIAIPRGADPTTTLASAITRLHSKMVGMPDCHMLTLAHLRKPGNTRDDDNPMPSMHDLKGAQELIGVPDNIWILWRNYDKKANDGVWGQSVVRVAKNRDDYGTTGDVDLIFNRMARAFCNVQQVPMIAPYLDRPLGTGEEEYDESF